MYKKAWCTCKVVVLLIKPIAFLPFSLPSASLLLKLPSYWCAMLRRSRNQRNVGSCWLKSLTGFKLCATTRNKIQQHATGRANGRNMFDMPTFKSDWNNKFLLWKQRGRWVETKLSQSIQKYSVSFVYVILMGPEWWISYTYIKQDRDVKHFILLSWSKFILKKSNW